jgi:hypothetical protein
VLRIGCPIAGVHVMHSYLVWCSPTAMARACCMVRSLHGLVHGHAGYCVHIQLVDSRLDLPPPPIVAGTLLKMQNARLAPPALLASTGLPRALRRPTRFAVSSNSAARALSVIAVRAACDSCTSSTPCTARSAGGLAPCFPCLATHACTLRHASHACTTCQANQYQDIACTATADTVCGEFPILLLRSPAGLARRALPTATAAHFPRMPAPLIGRQLTHARLPIPFAVPQPFARPNWDHKPGWGTAPYRNLLSMSVVAKFMSAFVDFTNFEERAAEFVERLGTKGPPGTAKPGKLLGDLVCMTKGIAAT